MIANMNKNNTGKLLVAVLAMAMVIAGCAVVFSDDVQAETVKPTDFLKEINENGGVYTVDGNQEVTVTEPITGLKQIKGTEGQNYTLTINFQATQKYQAMIVVDDTEGLKIDGVNVVLNMTAASNLNGAGDGLTVFGGAVSGGSATDSTGNVTVQNSASLTISQAASAHGASWRAGDLIVNGATVDFNQANSTGNLTVDLVNATLRFTNPNATPGNLNGNANGSKIIATGATANSLNFSTINLNNSTVDTDGDVGVYEGQTFKMTGTSSITADELYTKNSNSATGAPKVSGGTITADIVSAPESTDNNKIPGMEINDSNVEGSVSTDTTTTSGYNLNGLDVKLNQIVYSGIIKANTEITNANAILVDVTVNPGITITFGDAISEIQSYGDMRLYGILATKYADGTIININDGASITAYANSKILSGVTVAGAGKIDISAAMSTVNLDQDIISNVIWSQSQTIVITESLTIKSSYSLTVLGQLIINEGVTLTVEDGAFLYIGSGDAQALGMTVNGDIEVEENGTVNVVKAQKVDVSGQIYSNGIIKIESNVNILEGGVIEIDDADTSKITVTDGMTIEKGGELKVSADMVIEKIDNEGTITLDGANIVEKNSIIHMTADGAVVDIKSFTQDTGKCLTIDDEGMYLYTNDNDEDVKIFTGERNVVSFDGGITTVDKLASDAPNGVGVRNIMITASLTSEEIDKDTTNYYNSLILSGSPIIYNNSDSEFNGYYKIKANAYNNDAKEDTLSSIEVPESLTLGKNVIFQLNGGVMNVDGTITATSEGSDISSAGEIYVNGMITLNQEAGEIDTGINAFFYEDDDNFYYTTLKTSIDNGATDIDYLGQVSVLDNVTIPADTTLSEGIIAGKITIGSTDARDVTVTVANGATVRNCIIEVMGTMVFENNKSDNKSVSGITSDVIIDEEPMRTYTNIYTALDIESGTVTLARDVYLDKDAEIKTGVTLEVPVQFGLYLYDDVTLTVNGTLKSSGEVGNANGADEKGEPVVGVGFNPKTDKHATIDVNGTFMSMERAEYSKYFIPGAYYQIVNTDGSWYYITPVEQAAAVSNDVEKGQIGIFGENTVGDVAFTGDADQPVIVTINAEGSLTAGTVTIDEAGIIVYGAFTGTVSSENGAVDIQNAKMISVNNATVDDEVITSIAGYPVAADVDLDSSVSITSGTINVDEIIIGIVNLAENGDYVLADYGLTADDADIDSFTIAEGATAVVSGETASMVASKLTVDGTLNVTQDGTIVIDELTVRGTLTVAVEDKENQIVAGNANINTLYVGIAMEQSKDKTIDYYVDASAAAVNADTIEGLQYVYMSAESTIAGKLTEKMISTEFYVEDALWMTAYAAPNATKVAITETDGNDVRYAIQPGDLDSSLFVSWNYENGDALEAGVTVGETDATKVYANLNYEIYTITVFADPGIQAVYIDGKLMTSGVFQNGYDGMWNEGFRLSVAAGEHEITYKLGNYFSGEATMTVNGTAVEGNTFTTSGTTVADMNVTIYLQGIEASAPETPSTSGGDDGMGLTDYLLIILVVLIVIMAIMVAMRLMRS